MQILTFRVEDVHLVVESDWVTYVLYAFIPFPRFANKSVLLPTAHIESNTKVSVFISENMAPPVRSYFLFQKYDIYMCQNSLTGAVLS